MPSLNSDPISFLVIKNISTYEIFPIWRVKLKLVDNFLLQIILAIKGLEILKGSVREKWKGV